MSRRTALVTGGAGFLGSHLVDRLLAEGMAVVVVDDFSTGRRENLAHLAGNPDFELVEADVVRTLPEVAADEIWNLACPASPPRYQADPVQTLMTSVLGVHRCLERARRTGARLFHASTSEVYGDPELHPQPETYRGAVNPIGPRACYDEGKRAAETLLFDYARTYRTDIRVARIFNTYGPRMDPEDGRVVSNFVVRALAGAPLELYGGGAQTRSFCYVDDLIEGVVRLMRSPTPPPCPVNLGNPGEFTVKALAEMVLAMTGSRSALVEKPMPADDPRLRRPDITLARTVLGWAPQIALADGLRRTIDHFAAVAERA